MPSVPKDQQRTSPGRVFTFSTLREKGIPFSKNHIRRLVAKGQFPAPFYMSQRRPAWSEATLDAWISEREKAVFRDWSPAAIRALGIRPADRSRYVEKEVK